MEFVFPKMEDDFIITAKELMFGNEKVEALHGGDTNKTASLKCEKEVPEGIFIRQKTRNPGQKPT